MSDSLRNKLFVGLIILGFAIYLFLYNPFQEEKQAYTPNIEKELIENGALESEFPLKLKLASNLYYVIAVDWDNLGSVSQEKLLNGQGQILGIKRAKDYLWLASKSHFPKNTPSESLLASLGIFDDDKNGVIDPTDKNYQSLSLIKIVDNMKSEVSNTLSGAGVAAIILNRDLANTFEAQSPILIGTAILLNNTKRAIFAVPMELIPIH